MLNGILALGTFKLNVHNSPITSFKSKCTLQNLLQQDLLWRTHFILFPNHRGTSVSTLAPVALHQTAAKYQIPEYLWIQRKNGAKIQVIAYPNIYLASADEVGFGRQQIDHFSFALVSPLRAEHHRRLVPGVVARSLLTGRGGLIQVLVVFRRPGERHGGGGCSLSVSRRLNCPQEWHCHICNFIADDVRARRAGEVRRCARASRLQGVKTLSPQQPRRCVTADSIF